MFVTLHGAANEVTGSCYLIETGNARLLVDCGMFQGSKHLERLNFIPASIKPKELDAVVLTHGHLDHCGRLPLLVRNGFQRKIYGTDATLDIARLILTDAAKIQVDDTDRENRKRAKAGQQAVKPLFNLSDVERVFKLFSPQKYNKWFPVAPETSVELVEAGHILGSSSVIIVAGQNGGKRRLVFSGDLGQWDIPLNRDPAEIDRADAVFMESTYGGRNHPAYEETVTELRNCINEAIENKGKILVPTFAVGRTQQLLFHLFDLFRKGELKRIPVYLDSPMALAATQIYSRHTELLDEDAKDFFSGDNIYHYLPNLKLCTTALESQALNDVEGPCLIMAGAGMCDAGRILHHLRHNLGLPNTLVLIVGYQAKESFGRRLIDGANPVKIMGQTVFVRAKIKSVQGFSAHAGQTDLLRWLEPLARHKTKLFLTHGEPHQLNELRFKVEESFQVKAEVPSIGDVIEL
ncbi:MAG: MBL fold metallo-hydrolase [Candidatus Melainabacteria bacterium]|nr:MAG: MBL fold metallo-hydrolase [Candidatus Melainabacteria bacterium]